VSFLVLLCVDLARLTNFLLSPLHPNASFLNCTHSISVRKRRPWRGENRKTSWSSNPTLIFVPSSSYVKYGSCDINMERGGKSFSHNQPLLLKWWTGKMVSYSKTKQAFEFHFLTIYRCLKLPFPKSNGGQARDGVNHALSWEIFWLLSWNVQCIYLSLYCPRCIEIISRKMSFPFPVSPDILCVISNLSVMKFWYLFTVETRKGKRIFGHGDAHTHTHPAF